MTSVSLPAVAVLATLLIVMGGILYSLNQEESDEEDPHTKEESWM